MEPVPLPNHPYRGLNSFRYIDRDIFAGRETEVSKIYKLILQYRGIMVFGQSGIGKSSLIASGLMPLLQDESFNTEIVRLNPDYDGTFVVSRTVSNESPTSYLPSTFDEYLQADNPGCDKINMSLQEFDTKVEQLQKPAETFDPINKHNGEKRKITVLIFDQFEELITQFEEADLKVNELTFADRIQLQEKIIGLITKWNFTDDLLIKLVFVFREDYLAKFGKLFNNIPDLKDHYLRVKPLSTSETLRIISRPFDTEEKKQHFRPPFSDSLLELMSTKIAAHFKTGVLVLSEVQIVCMQVYNEKTPALREKLITTQPIATIIRQFNVALLNSLKASERDIAIDILSLLVLNKSSRNIYHEKAIYEKLKRYPPASVKQVLDNLESNISLIRKENRLGGTYYEIISEAIIPYINDKKDEKRISRKINRIILFSVVVALPLLLGVAWVVWQSVKNSRIAQLKDKEASWYQHIPDDSSRDAFIEKLLQGKKEDYDRYRTAFQLVAQSYTYSASSQHSNAYAALFVADKLINTDPNSGKVTGKINQRLNEYLLPYKTADIPANNKELTFVAGRDGHYFMVDGNNQVTVHHLSADSLIKRISVFARGRRGENFTTYELVNTSNDVRFRRQKKATIVLAKRMGETLYSIYNTDSCLFYDKEMNRIDSLSIKGPDILGILPYKDDKFIILYGTSDYESYRLDNLQKESQRISLFPEGYRKAPAVRVITYPDKRCFSIILANDVIKHFYIDEKGKVTLRDPADVYEQLLNINQQGLRLVSTTSDYFRIRRERAMSSTFQASYAFLLQDTNLAISYNHDKAMVYALDSTTSGIALRRSDIINYLPIDLVPTLISRKENTFIKHDQSYFYYNLKTKKRQYLVSFSGTPLEYIQETGKNPMTQELFLNDSIFAVFTDGKANFFNLKSRVPSRQMGKLYDSAMTLMAYDVLKFNDDIDKPALSAIFGNKLTTGKLDRHFYHGEYKECIELANKYLQSPQTKENKIRLYEYIYDSYSNLSDLLPPKKENVPLQIGHLREVIKCADALLKLGEDSSTYFNRYLRNMGSLSWYLLINKEYESGLDTAKLALRMDKDNNRQWINTNLALGYLFTNNLPRALEVYRKWKNTPFNDDNKIAKVRFLEDIESLKSDYGIDIPYKKEVLRELTSD